MGIKPKKKICEVCGKESYIFSKGRCKPCTQNSYTWETKELKPKTKVVFKSKARHRDSVKSKREGLGDFFQEKASLASGRNCENCHKPLQGGTSVEIAHILSKSSYPEVCTNENNFLYLCQSCHNRFDEKDPRSMPIFDIAKQKVITLIPLIGLYKKEIEKFLTYEEFEKIMKND